MDRPSYLTPSDAARLLQIATGELTKMVELQLVPFARLPSGSVTFDEADLVAWLRALKVAPRESSLQSNAPV
jgi:hypothetical protein